MNHDDHMSKTNTALVVGLPRSGSSLVCTLLDQLDDAVTLQEPMDVGQFSTSNNGLDTLELINQFASSNRRSLMTAGTALSRQVGGQTVSNYAARSSWHGELRKSLSRVEAIRIDKQLAPDFLLLIKHNAAFAALLPVLIKHYPVYAVIRNPLSVLLSWQTVAMPVQKGHIPAAERLDATLADALKAEQDTLARQIIILEWFFQQFHQNLEDRHIIRYEEVIETQGRRLQAIHPSAGILDAPLTSKNDNPAYPDEPRERIRQRLLDSEGYQWSYYDKNSL